MAELIEIEIENPNKETKKAYINPDHISCIRPDLQDKKQSQIILISGQYLFVRNEEVVKLI